MSPLLRLMTQQKKSQSLSLLSKLHSTNPSSRKKKHVLLLKRNLALTLRLKLLEKLKSKPNLLLRKHALRLRLKLPSSLLKRRPMLKRLSALLKKLLGPLLCRSKLVLRLKKRPIVSPLKSK